jgi:hypothetical protein
MPAKKNKNVDLIQIAYRVKGETYVVILYYQLNKVTILHNRKTNIYSGPGIDPIIIESGEAYEYGLWLLEEIGYKNG